MSSPSLFYATLVGFLRVMTTRFPDHEGVKGALEKLELLGSNPSFHPTLRDTWRAASEDILEEIKAHNPKVVGRAFTEYPNPVISGMGIEDVLNDDEVAPATKEQIWVYLNLLTDQAHGTFMPTPGGDKEADTTQGDDKATKQGTEKEAKQDEAGAVASSNQGGEAKAAAPKKGPDLKKMLDDLATSLPAVMASVNEVLKTEEGENPLVDMARQFMNPNDVRPGFANNVLANMMQDQSTAMESTEGLGDLSVDEIARRLRRLDHLERSHSRRRRMRRKNGREKILKD